MVYSYPFRLFQNWKIDKEERMMQKWNRFFCGSLLAGCLLAGSV